jgi:hypothetical protein
VAFPSPAGFSLQEKALCAANLPRWRFLRHFGSAETEILRWDSKSKSYLEKSKNYSARNVNQSCFRTGEEVNFQESGYQSERLDRCRPSARHVNFYGGPPPWFADRPEGKSRTIAFCGFRSGDGDAAATAGRSMNTTIIDVSLAVRLGKPKVLRALGVVLVFF